MAIVQVQRFVAVMSGVFFLYSGPAFAMQAREGSSDSTASRRVEFRGGARIGATQRAIVTPPDGPLGYRVPWSAAYGLDIEVRGRIRSGSPWWLRGRAFMSASMGWRAKLTGDSGPSQTVPLRQQNWGFGVALDRDITGPHLLWRISPELGYGFLPVFSHVEHAIPNYLMHGPLVALALAVKPSRFQRLQVFLRPQARVLNPDSDLQEAFVDSRHPAPPAQFNLGLAAGLRFRILAQLALAISWESHRGIVDVGMPDRLRRAAWLTLAFDDLH